MTAAARRQAERDIARANELESLAKRCRARNQPRTAAALDGLAAQVWTHILHGPPLTRLAEDPQEEPQ